MVPGPVLFSPTLPIAQYEIGDYRNFVYLALDWRARVAAIVDPQRDLDRPLADLEANGFSLQAILLTHTHPDHTAGVPGLLRKFPEIPLVLHEKDAHRLPDSMIQRKQTRLAKDQESIRIGGLALTLIHTPGHSAGGACYFFEDAKEAYLLTGDTLFIRDCGRTDLDTGSNEEMFASLQKLKKLPKNAVILPGHHYAKEYSSTLEVEIQSSPPMRCRSVQELSEFP